MCGKVWFREDSKYLDKSYMVNLGSYVIDSKYCGNIGRSVTSRCLLNLNKVYRVNQVAQELF